MHVVEVGVVHIPFVSTHEPRRKRRHLHRLPLGNDAARGLHVDEASDQIHETIGVRLGDVMDAEIRPTELAHAARVKPDPDAVLFVGSDDRDVRARAGIVFFEERFSELLGRPPPRRLGVEHADATRVERRSDQADGVTEVIERRRVRELAPEHERHRGGPERFLELGIVLEHLAQRGLVEGVRETLRARLRHVEAFGLPADAVLRARRLQPGGEVSEHVKQHHRAPTARHEMGPRPRLES